MISICELCPRHCGLEIGQVGFCRARKNVNGNIVADNYGKLTSVALDPIEKKPLHMFYPKSRILSIGSYGCNLRCPFCQNHTIAQVDGEHAQYVYVSPEEIVQKAIEFKNVGNIGLAYTYNEPIVGFEYVMDCAKLIHANNMKNVMVTNGIICERPLLELLPFIDAWNIDLKGFTSDFYYMVRGELEIAKATIAIAAQKSHVEVTTLIIPGKNDSIQEMEELSTWLASVDPNIPLHVTRFFPMYKMTDIDATPVEIVYALANVATKHLKHVFVGNC